MARASAMTRAVTPATGIAAAPACSSDAGLRAIVPSDIVTNSASVPSPRYPLPTEPNTSSPTDQAFTPAPTASTVPEPSMPGTRGNRCSIRSFRYPWTTALSKGFSPAAATRTRTCPSAGSGTGSSWMDPGCPRSPMAKAFMSAPLRVSSPWEASDARFLGPRNSSDAAVAIVRADTDLDGESDLEEALHRLRGLLHLGLGALAARDAVGDAVAQMILQQRHRDLVQGRVDRGDLGEDVDAVGVRSDHPLDPAHLPLDPAQAPLETFLVVVVPRQGAPPDTCNIPPRGIRQRSARGDHDDLVGGGQLHPIGLRRVEAHDPVPGPAVAEGALAEEAPRGDDLRERGRAVRGEPAGRAKRDRGTLGVEQLVEDLAELDPLGQLREHQARQLVADDEVVHAGQLGDVDVPLVEHFGDQTDLRRMALRPLLAQRHQREQRPRVGVARRQAPPVPEQDALVVLLAPEQLAQQLRPAGHG